MDAYEKWEGKTWKVVEAYKKKYPQYRFGSALDVSPSTYTV